MITLIGKNSQLGRTFLELSKFKITSLSSKDLDLENSEEIKNVLRKTNSRYVLNFAAYNDVENCDYNSALKINGTALKHIASFCKDSDSILIHISSDYVFNGSKGNYQETDLVDPINSYGASKLLGEQHIKKSGCKYLILRTSWLYSSKQTPNNFLRKIFHMISYQGIQSFQGVDNLYGSPTSCFSLANYLINIINFIDKSKVDFNEFGIYHAVDNGRVSRYEFLEKLLFLIKHRYGLNYALNSVQDDYFPSNIKRPYDTSLQNSKLKKTFGVECLEWDDALFQEVERL